MKWLLRSLCLAGVCAACAGTEVLSAERLQLGREVMHSIYSLNSSAGA